MKTILTIAAGMFAMTSAAESAAPTRPAVEHLGRPNLNGQALPFSDAVRVGDVLYLSGQLGVVDGKLPDGIEAQTKQALENVGAILKRAGLGYTDVFHCTAMLDNMSDWPAFNRVYVTYFTPGRLPARSALGADGLALGALVEVECQAWAGARRAR